ncbi:hypothetical protein Stube_32470 [Streptomyces tubercidicus]|uniref:Uncharacterized protein n=1 Tax=Streptomyces tubercidicus TaxID=47759 RepID=A0A640UT70_9ACTN|nr:hypothetical protein Stube_32470 [Streptomyces tubercidicus]
MGPGTGRSVVITLRTSGPPAVSWLTARICGIPVSDMVSPSYVPMAGVGRMRRLAAAFPEVPPAFRGGREPGGVLMANV